MVLLPSAKVKKVREGDREKGGNVITNLSLSPSPYFPHSSSEVASGGKFVRNACSLILSM
jgi:hypothetical protein